MPNHQNLLLFTLTIGAIISICFVFTSLLTESSSSNFVESEPAVDMAETSTTIKSEQLLFVPEGYRRLEDYTIVIDVAILPNTLQAVWVEYGLDANSLDVMTERMSNELGMGSVGEYGSYSLIIDAEALIPGRSYFYQIVGETTEGKFLRTGLNRFTSGK